MGEEGGNKWDDKATMEMIKSPSAGDVESLKEIMVVTVRGEEISTVDERQWLAKRKFAETCKKIRDQRKI